MYHPFSVADTIKTAWYLLRKNFSVIAIYTLLSFFIIGAIGVLFLFILTDDLWESIGVIVMLVIISFLFLGFIKLIFQLIDREYYDFAFADMVPKVKMLFSYILLLIIVSSLAVFAKHSIALLRTEQLRNIVDNLVEAFFDFFFLYYFPICACFIVDDESGPFESVRQSFHLIKGNFLKYLLLLVIIALLAYIGKLTYRIAMLFVIPLVNIILVVAYRKLVYSHQDVDDDLAETK